MSQSDEEDYEFGEGVSKAERLAQQKELIEEEEMSEDEIKRHQEQADIYRRKREMQKVGHDTLISRYTN